MVGRESPDHRRRALPDARRQGRGRGSQRPADHCRTARSRIPRLGARPARQRPEHRSGAPPECADGGDLAAGPGGLFQRRSAPLGPRGTCPRHARGGQQPARRAGHRGRKGASGRRNRRLGRAGYRRGGAVGLARNPGAVARPVCRDRARPGLPGGSSGAAQAAAARGHRPGKDQALEHGAAGPAAAALWPGSSLWSASDGQRL